MSHAFKNASLLERKVGKQLVQSIADCQQLIEEKEQDLSAEEMAYCAAEIKRVSGALTMLSSATPALLAQEISACCYTAKDLQGSEQGAMLALLAQSLADLKIAAEQHTLNAGANYYLLSVINKLRAQRGEKAVPASEVHSVDFDAVPVNQNLDASTDRFIAVARNQCHQFQAALLAWYQDCRDPGSINTLVTITDSLRLAASERPHIQFFEVIAALIDSQRGCRQISQAIRLLLAYVERYIRQLANAEAGYSYVPTALIKEALYHIVTNSHHNSERVRGILGRYGLRDRRSRGRGNDSDKKIAAHAVQTPAGVVELTELKADSVRQALNECRRELAALEHLLESWFAAEAQNEVLISASDACYRIMRCFDLLGMERQARICACAQSFLVELQTDLRAPAHGARQKPDTDRYMVFAEAIAALACFLDEVTCAGSAMSLDIENVLQLSETRFAELAVHPLVPVSLGQAAENSATDQRHVSASEESMAVNDLVEETEELLVDFDSLLETSDLLALSDAAIASSDAGEAATDIALVDRDIIDGFVGEATDLLDQLDTQVALWRSDGEWQGPVQEIQRLLHTLKGSARIAVYRNISDLCHGLESMLSSVQTGLLLPSQSLMESIQQSIDSMREVFAIEHRQSVSQTQDESETMSRDIKPQISEGAAKELAQNAAEITSPAPEPDFSTPRQDSDDHDPLADESLSRLFRLNAEELVDQAALFEEVGKAMAAVAELDPIIYRLSGELEHSSGSSDQQVRLTEAVSDLHLAANQVLRHVGHIESCIDDAAAATGLMRQVLMDARMVALDIDAGAYQRLVELTAKTLDKNVELSIDSSNVKFDRGVLRQVFTVLGHLLRNAVDHGIESEELRVRAGKPARASICVRCSVATKGIAIAVADDGAGIDTRMVWRRAVSKNLVDKSEPFDEVKAIELLFEPLISTKSQVTQVSGRGVGLDAVKTEIERMHGTMEVDSEFGQGSCFTLYLPYSHGLVPATIVTVGDQRFALPGLLESVPVEMDQLVRQITVGKKTYQCHHLAARLLIKTRPYKGRLAQALLMADGDEAIALIVDEVEGSEHILIDSMGPQLSHAVYLSGFGLLEDGALVPVLERAYFLRTGNDLTGAPSLPDSSVPEDGPPASKTILLVDDSLTTRRYCEKLLLGHGYHVVAARTAEEAQDMANKITVDLLVSDLQLPQMNGYQLIDSLRQQPQYQTLPVVLISASEYDESRAQQHGIAVWLNKPYRDRELYDAVKRLIKRH